MNGIRAIRVNQMNFRQVPSLVLVPSGLLLRAKNIALSASWLSREQKMNSSETHTTHLAHWPLKSITSKPQSLRLHRGKQAKQREDLLCM